MLNFLEYSCQLMLPHKIEKENPQLPLLLVYLQAKEISQLTKSGGTCNLFFIGKKFPKNRN
jgi:hypothetical protein